MNIFSVLRQEKEHTKKVSKQARRAIMVAMLACTLMLVLQFVCALFIPRVNDEVLSILVDIAMYCTYLLIPFALAKLVYKKLFRTPNEITVKRSSPKMPVLFIAGTLGLGYLVNFIVNLLFGWLIQNEPTTMDTPQSALAIVLTYVLMAVCPAIIEEWAFRGVLLKHLRPYGRLGAIIISSFLFGLMHIDIPRVIFASIFGFLLGICYDYTGSIKLTMLIHFLNNAIAVTITLVGENLVVLMILSIFLYSLMGCGIAALIYYLNMGLSRKKLSFYKPAAMGYKLSAGRFLTKAILNFGLIPLILSYSVFFYLIYFL